MTYKIKTINIAEDYPKMINLWQRNLPNWPKEKYIWQYKNNYYQQPKSIGITTEDDSKYIGAETIFPRDFIINGEKYRAGVTGDFVMDQAYRILGPALKLQKAVISSYQNFRFNFLLGMPNKQAKPVKIRVGFKIVGRSIEMVKLLRTNSLLKKYIASESILRCCQFILDVILRLISKENFVTKKPKLVMEIVKSFDDRFEEFWISVQKNYLIIGERTPDYLNWRFMKCPYEDYQIAALILKPTTIIGYIVFFKSGNQINIVDFLTLDLDNTMRQLLAYFLRYIRSLDVEKVYFHYFGNQYFTKQLKSFGFIKRGIGNDIIQYGIENIKDFFTINSQNNWFLSQADFD
jgi:hypothetical protein